MVFTTSIPSTTSPKTACRSSSHGVATCVIKNCEPPVFWPRLAIESTPGLPCLKSGWNSSRMLYPGPPDPRSEEHTSELQSRQYLVCRLLFEKKKKTAHLATEISRHAPL